MEPQKTPNSQSILEKKEQSWRHHTLWFQATLQAIVIKQYGIGISIKTYTQTTETKSRSKFTLPQFKSGPRILYGGKTISSINGTGKLDIYLQKNVIGPLFYTVHKY